jgi:stromal membrane-associated protein
MSRRRRLGDANKGSGGGKKIDQKAALDGCLRLKENMFCADCGARGPRWASVNLGIFICIRCAGIHRSVGVHITLVRSVSLDTWKPEHIERCLQVGNEKARQIYEANVPSSYRRPNVSDTYGIEQWVRAKYERKEFVASDSEIRQVLGGGVGEANHNDEKPRQRQDPAKHSRDGDREDRRRRRRQPRTNIQQVHQQQQQQPLFSFDAPSMSAPAAAPVAQQQQQQFFAVSAPAAPAAVGGGGMTLSSTVTPGAVAPPADLFAGMSLSPAQQQQQQQQPQQPQQSYESAKNDILSMFQLQPAAAPAAPLYAGQQHTYPGMPGLQTLAMPVQQQHPPQQFMIQQQQQFDMPMYGQPQQQMADFNNNNNNMMGMIQVPTMTTIGQQQQQQHPAFPF